MKLNTGESWSTENVDSEADCGGATSIIVTGSTVCIGYWEYIDSDGNLKFA
ncbi:MAG: hypothetical protein JXQ30_09705 [Spirochaetes bacterium]|nr:hypothetical protein [Spirochaetota bacterium]